VARARGLVEPMRLFAIAVGFLTRAPVPRIDVEADDLRRASAFFPLVGLGVAGVGVVVRAAVEPLWGPGVGTIAAIVAMVAVTGAFHEDGLADTADGLWGGWNPAARLAIMRDSRIGTYGTVALIAALGLRASLLLPLGLADFARAVACGHVLGRASTLLLARLLPAADGSPNPAADAPGSLPAAGGRTAAGRAGVPGAENRAEGLPAAYETGGLPLEGGPAGPPLNDGTTGPPVEGGTAGPVPGDARGAGAAGRMGPASVGGRPRLGASVVGALGAWGVGGAVAVVAATLGLAARAWAPVPLAAGLVVCLGCARLFRRRLGGITGDALGAANQVVDLAAIAAITALAKAGLL
jgi:cobalamin synthase